MWAPGSLSMPAWSDAKSPEVEQSHAPSAASCDAVHLGIAMLEDELSEEWLASTCKTQDLASLCSVELRVDSALQSIDAIGFFLPNLRHLKLSGSNVACIRDLGTSLCQLEVLWMSRCNLQDLSGIGAIPSLQEFYLPFNHVSDLSPLISHDAIEVLDLEGNSVQSLEDVQMLGMCSQLHELTLVGNPVTDIPGFSRSAVLLVCPELAILDDEAADEGPNKRSACSDRRQGASSNASDHVSISDGLGTARPLQQLSFEHPLLSQALSDYHSGQTDFSASRSEPTEMALILEQLKSMQPKHVMSAVSDSAGKEFRDIGSAPSVVRPHTADSAELAVLRWPALETIGSKRTEDSSSDLTCGNALFGSPLAAVRQRRRVVGAELGGVDVDIRELLRRYQTFTQTSCLQPEELEALKVEAPQRRLCTPDVRIHSGRASRAGSRPSSALGFNRDHDQHFERPVRASTAGRVRASAKGTMEPLAEEALNVEHHPALTLVRATSKLPDSSRETVLSNMPTAAAEVGGHAAGGYPSNSLRPSQGSARLRADGPPLAPSPACAGRLFSMAVGVNHTLDLQLDQWRLQGKLSHVIPKAPVKQLREEMTDTSNHLVTTRAATLVDAARPHVPSALCQKDVVRRGKRGVTSQEFDALLLAPAPPCVARSLSCCSQSPLVARRLRTLGPSRSPREGGVPCVAVC